MSNRCVALTSLPRMRAIERGTEGLFPSKQRKDTCLQTCGSARACVGESKRITRSSKRSSGACEREEDRAFGEAKANIDERSTGGISGESPSGRHGLGGQDFVVYPCLSSSSDDHHLSHSCLGTGMRLGMQNKFCHCRASLVHLVSLIVS